MAEIIIIGGGASGMAAAIRAARNRNNTVTVLERQARVGKKLLVTGNGRCNLTNRGETAGRYHGGEPAFCAPALARYPAERVLAFFAGLGLMTVTEYGGRVYPRSGHAASVLDVLRLGMERAGVQVTTGAAAERIRRGPAGFTVEWEGGRARADKVLIACGGCAGTRAGGVRDGYRLLESLGHSVTALHPALTFLRTPPEYPRAMKGIRVDAALRLLGARRELGFSRGDVLFADNGVSGTAAFDLARAVSAEPGKKTVSLDFLPECSLEELALELEARRDRWGEKPASVLFTGMLQSRVGQMLCKYAGIGGNVTADRMDGPALRRLCEGVKDFRLPVTGVGDFNAAQVTAGGVKTDGFDPDTLESRLCPGLFASGEVLDVDGDCGGFNLQWAWASGLLAGEGLCC